MATSNLLQDILQQYDNKFAVPEVAVILLLFIILFSVILYLFCELFTWARLKFLDMAPNMMRTNHHERAESTADIENETFLRIDEAFGTLRLQNQHHQQQQRSGNNFARKLWVIRKLPKPEFYGRSCNRIMNNTTECVICMEELVSDDVCRVLPICKHIYHLECIDKWLLNHQLTCPICRSSAIKS